MTDAARIADAEVLYGTGKAGYGKVVPDRGIFFSPVPTAFHSRSSKWRMFQLRNEVGFCLDICSRWWRIAARGSRSLFLKRDANECSFAFLPERQRRSPP